jgi:hypothetical protein
MTTLAKETVKMKNGQTRHIECTIILSEWKEAQEAEREKEQGG